MRWLVMALAGCSHGTGTETVDVTDSGLILGTDGTAYFAVAPDFESALAIGATAQFSDGGVRVRARSEGASLDFTIADTEVQGATSTDATFSFPIEATWPDGVTLTEDDAIFFRWTAFPNGYEGFAYFVGGAATDREVVVYLGSEEPVIHSCSGLEGSVCEERQTPEFRFDPEQLSADCTGNGGVFSEAPCDRSTAVGECVWPEETLVIGANYCDQPGNGPPESLCADPIGGSSPQYTELNGGCP